MVTDGKWVEDDYYEEKSLEEITARGLKAGDPVGELPDPNAFYQSAEASAANALNAVSVGNAKNDRSGAGVSMGIYRAGGPTTIFGASGWGPFSDGPLNAVRKSLLSRDGVTEENWMWMAATRVLEANEEWSKWRKEGIKELKTTGEAVAKPEVEEDYDQPPAAKRPRLEGALGVYEPHSGIVHCEFCLL